MLAHLGGDPTAIESVLVAGDRVAALLATVQP
jgi:hypothetical protein